MVVLQTSFRRKTLVASHTANGQEDGREDQIALQQTGRSNQQVAICYLLLRYLDMEVSGNEGTPQWMVHFMENPIVRDG